MTLPQTIAKWRCIKLCAIFSGSLCIGLIILCKDEFCLGGCYDVLMFTLVELKTKLTVFEF